MRALFSKKSTDKKAMREKEPTPDPMTVGSSPPDSPTVQGRSPRKVSFLETPPTNRGTSETTGQPTTPAKSQTTTQAKTPATPRTTAADDQQQVSSPRALHKEMIAISLSPRSPARTAANRHHIRASSAPVEMERSPSRTSPQTPRAKPASPQPSTPPPVPRHRTPGRTPGSPYQATTSGNAVNPAFLGPRSRTSPANSPESARLRPGSLLFSPQHQVLVTALRDYTRALEDTGMKLAGEPRALLDRLWADVYDADNVDWDEWQLHFTSFGLLHEPASGDLHAIAARNSAVISACHGMQK